MPGPIDYSLIRGQLRADHGSADWWNGAVGSGAAVEVVYDHARDHALGVARGCASGEATGGWHFES